MAAATGYDVSAMVNVPLGSDKVALRVVGFSTEDAGYIDNVLSTSPLGQLFPEKGLSTTRTSSRTRQQR
jgi:hypothetical protein